jgi:hypothetical protein
VSETCRSPLTVGIIARAMEAFGKVGVLVTCRLSEAPRVPNGHSRRGIGLHRSNRRQCVLPSCQGRRPPHGFGFCDNWHLLRVNQRAPATMRTAALRRFAWFAPHHF